MLKGPYSCSMGKGGCGNENAFTFDSLKDGVGTCSQCGVRWRVKLDDKSEGGFLTYVGPKLDAKP